LALIPILEEVKERLSEIITAHQLGGESVWVKIGPLPKEQAIGTPGRQDYALLEGQEVMIEAQFRESPGQAFTDQPRTFEGTINDVQRLKMDIPGDRAVFISALNAVTAYLGIATRVRHCRNDEPEQCGRHIAEHILETYGKPRIGMIGYQPAILENLVQSFGTQNVMCSDLNPRNINSTKFGIEIWDGKTQTDNLVARSDLLLVTGSTAANDTLDDIRQNTSSQGKKLIVFGVTGAGVCAFLGLERICPFGH
jgi:uncharacterized protein (DUF4213/DUF364 family)